MIKILSTSLCLALAAFTLPAFNVSADKCHGKCICVTGKPCPDKDCNCTEKGVQVARCDCLTKKEEAEKKAA